MFLIYSLIFLINELLKQIDTTLQLAQWAKKLKKEINIFAFERLLFISENCFFLKNISLTWEP